MIARRRINNLANYAYLATNFRNSIDLIRSYRQGPRCHKAVLWNGFELMHPEDRDGLVGTILEVWKDRCYTRDGFYRPQPGDQIVDAGAHVGLFSLSMAFANPGCRIAIEPFAENYQCLLTNLGACHVTNVTARPFAIGGETRRAFMQAVGTRSIDHLLQDSPAPGRPSVQVISLEGILEQLNTDRVAFLKMDVEGAQYDAFAAASRETIRCFERIAMEYHENLRPGTLDLLHDRLTSTHELTIEPTFDRGYGILRANLR